MLLALCARRAGELGRPQLLSISLRVRHIDPLTVLFSTRDSHDRHAYIEHPAGDVAVMAIATAWEAAANGPQRFQEIRDAARALQEDAVHAGDTDVPFAGPHFFAAFTFEENAREGRDPFPAAHVFLPCWQVSRRDGAYTAVANILVEENAALEALADRILSAHRRFQNFEYADETRGAECDIAEGSGTVPGENVRAVELGGAWHQGGVEHALELITAGLLQKVVLARTWSAHSPAPFKTGRALERLRERFPACHTFSFSCPLPKGGSAGVFIGATPERLVSLGGGCLHTEAIAGTAPRGEHAVDDARIGAGLLGEDKERREHEAVLADILARLKMLGIDARADGPARLVSLANVLHLRTPISACHSPGVHLLDVAAALYPTPAVGGVPREAAIALIAASEPMQRGLFSGLLGWFDANGEGCLLVGLRSAWLDASGYEARLYAGSGIVSGASPAYEATETAAKARAMAWALSVSIP